MLWDGNEVERLVRIGTVFEDLQEVSESGMFTRTQHVENDTLERRQSSSSFFKTLQTDVAVRGAHWSRSIYYNEHSEATFDQIKGSLLDAAVGFTAIEHDLLLV